MELSSAPNELKRDNPDERRLGRDPSAAHEVHWCELGRELGRSSSSFHRRRSAQSRMFGGGAELQGGRRSKKMAEKDLPSSTGCAIWCGSLGRTDATQLRFWPGRGGHRLGCSRVSSSDGKVISKQERRQGQGKRGSFG